MKVIFLDFNGVLDTYDNMNVIDECNLSRLKFIVSNTGAQVVLISSIKNSYLNTGIMSKQLKYVLRTLKESDIPVIGFTSNLETREDEISLYLEEHPEILNFCIIDDEYYMKKFGDNMVKLQSQMVVGQKGLQDEDMYKAIEILNRRSLARK